jgi:D-3-phosphoglycerate dehydrogenase
MIKILYLGAEVGATAAEQAAAGRANIVRIPANAGDVQTEIKTADALLDASMKAPITDAMVASAANLKIISCATTGSDHIERTELNRRGIPVRTLMEDKALLLNLTPAAELSWALLMACARMLPESRGLGPRTVSGRYAKRKADRYYWLRSYWDMDEPLCPCVWNGYCRI